MVIFQRHDRRTPKLVRRGRIRGQPAGAPRSFLGTVRTKDEAPAFAAAGNAEDRR
jgi:hypothetical protein